MMETDISGLCCGVSFVVKGIIRQVMEINFSFRIYCLPNVVSPGQCSGNRYFEFWFLCQRDPYRVSEAIFKKCADPYGRLYSTILSITGLCNTEVKRIILAVFDHSCD